MSLRDSLNPDKEKIRKDLEEGIKLYEEKYGKIKTTPLRERESERLTNKNYTGLVNL